MTNERKKRVTTKMILIEVETDVPVKELRKLEFWQPAAPIDGCGDVFNIKQVAVQAADKTKRG